MAVKAECKAGGDRLSFNQIKPEQIEFMQAYTGLGFFWIQLGLAKAGSSSSFARQVWMIEKHFFFDAMEHITDVCGVNYIPINPEAIALSNMRYKHPDLTMSTLFETSKMEWLGESRWRPNKHHIIWSYNLETTYHDFPNCDEE